MPSARASSVNPADPAFIRANNREWFETAAAWGGHADLAARLTWPGPQQDGLMRSRGGESAGLLGPTPSGDVGWAAAPRCVRPLGATRWLVFGGCSLGSSDQATVEACVAACP